VERTATREIAPVKAARSIFLIYDEFEKKVKEKKNKKKQETNFIENALAGCGALSIT
jgi:hypothetical protein